MLAAGSIVTSNVPLGTVVVGNRALSYVTLMLFFSLRYLTFLTQMKWISEMDIESKIRGVFMSTLAEQGVLAGDELTRETELLKSGLDSLGFAILVTKLEDELEYDPFTLMDTPFYPRTFGEFIDVYKKYSPKK
jgi:acyl carrier protein